MPENYPLSKPQQKMIDDLNSEKTTLLDIANPSLGYTYRDIGIRNAPMTDKETETVKTYLSNHLANQTTNN